jgi:hypothetical protein
MNLTGTLNPVSHKGAKAQRTACFIPQGRIMNLFPKVPQAFPLAIFLNSCGGFRAAAPFIIFADNV